MEQGKTALSELSERSDCRGMKMELPSKNRCCGCGACAQRCPQNCITMEEDEEGFRYPVIDEEKCIGCGLCEKTCPSLNRHRHEMKEGVYAASAKEQELVKRSSSGGMSGILAEYILQKEGVVFGAAFNEKMELVHCAAETEAECRKFHGSKYIQSNTRNTFAECKQYLDAGKYALYTGTPCQIAGLKQYLQKDYEKLLTAELICHGVPSPGIWRKYISELEEEKQDRIIDVSFRYKDRGWKEYRFRTAYEKGQTEVIPGAQSPYLAAFLNNLTLRPSCYECRHRLAYTQSDFMIGDFWGVGNYYQSFDEQLGVSALVILSEKGKKVFGEIKNKICWEKSDLSMLTPMNGCIQLSVFPNRNRTRLMEAYAEKGNVTKALSKYAVNYRFGDKIFRMGVWGSYNSRMVTQFLINGSRQKRIFHYSNSSVVSEMSDEKNWNNNILIDNQYRKEALAADWKKSFRKQFEQITANVDYILIDLLEERFDLLKDGSVYITESDAQRETDSCQDMEVVKQEMLLATGVWEEKMQQFVGLLESKFSYQQIILLEIYLSETYFDGREYQEFSNVQEIRQKNNLLKKIYELFLRYCPKAHHIKLNKEFQYSIYSHRYGCIPSHLNYEACFHLADKVYDIMVEER